MIRIKVPATSANIGPGFDCLGVALRLYNEVDLEVSDSLRIDIEGEGADIIPKNGNNLVFKAYRRTMGRLEETPHNLYIRQRNAIPTTRGLGSSSTAVVAGILAAQAISGKTLTREESLLIATQIEGHPDNVAPALYGGFVSAIGGTHDARCLSFPAPADLNPVALIPDYELPTAKARAVLPQSVPFIDAVFNVSHASFLVAAVAKGDIDALFAAVKDKLHQPYRAKLIDGFDEILEACLSLGCPAYLSGAGSTLMAFCRSEQLDSFTKNIKNVLAAHGNWEIRPLEVDNVGATVQIIDQ